LPVGLTRLVAEAMCRLPSVSFEDGRRAVAQMGPFKEGEIRFCGESLLAGRHARIIHSFNQM
jgi:hypothetical protein